MGLLEFFSSNPLTKIYARTTLTNLWSDAMWVNIPLLNNPRYAFNNPGNLPCDAKVRLRVKKPYRTRLSSTCTSYNANALKAAQVCDLFAASASTSTVATISSVLSSDSVASPINNNMGYYRFNTSDIYTKLKDADQAKSALDLINVVPNPYYAYSAYEQKRIDNIVRITNLPNVCKIKIFTLNGTLIRTFNRM